MRNAKRPRPNGPGFGWGAGDEAQNSTLGI
jgi:hypothetical protein